MISCSFTPVPAISCDFVAISWRFRGDFMRFHAISRCCVAISGRFHAFSCDFVLFRGDFMAMPCDFVRFRGDSMAIPCDFVRFRGDFTAIPCGFVRFRAFSWRFHGDSMRFHAISWRVHGDSMRKPPTPETPRNPPKTPCFTTHSPWNQRAPPQGPMISCSCRPFPAISCDFVAISWRFHAIS